MHHIVHAQVNGEHKIIFVRNVKSEEEAEQVAERILKERGQEPSPIIVDNVPH